jgi:hypothetical protein
MAEPLITQNTIKLECLISKRSGNLNIIPTSQNLGKIGDNNITILEIIKVDELDKEGINYTLKFATNDHPLDSVELGWLDTKFKVPKTLTKTQNLHCSLVISDDSGIIYQSNIITFRLARSLNNPTQAQLNQNQLNYLIDKGIITLTRIGNTMQLIQNSELVGTIEIPENRIISLNENITISDETSIY